LYVDGCPVPFRVPLGGRVLTFSRPLQGALGGIEIRYIVVIDGEHYPEVTEATLREVAAEHEVLCAVLAGGKEKLPKGGLDALEGFELRTGPDPRAELENAIRELSPDAVLDLSDDPVLDYRKRHELAAIALFCGVEYHGSDFAFRPPPRPRIATRPSVAIIGTGKRAGKTSVSGFVARHLKGRGIDPVIVAMGRGGPAEPEVMRGDEVELTPKDLLELVDSGKHGASDYIEDALLAQVPTVGCRRCGGGLAGGIDHSNVPEGVEISNGIPGRLHGPLPALARRPGRHYYVRGTVRFSFPRLNSLHQDPRCIPVPGKG
jgi:cyclic 2,3-diphosphoglycerate synthetase